MERAAVFTGEDAAKVNERANRKAIKPESATKSQLIEIACDTDPHGSPKGGGIAAKLYSRVNALALVQVTNNFTADWSRDRAMDRVCNDHEALIVTRNGKQSVSCFCVRLTVK